MRIICVVIVSRFVSLRYTMYGLDDWMIGVPVPAGAENFPLRHVHTGSGTYPASYPMGTGGKATGS
jgi:hypothetical protein